MTAGMLAIIIFGAILIQAALLLLILVLRHKKESHTLQKPAWEGFREFRVQKKVFEDKNKSICSFYLAPVDKDPLPSFKPGQFLTFQLPLKDPVTNKIKQTMRCYSLSDCPDDVYRITVKRVLPPEDRPDLPQGRSSSFFHESVKEGTVLQVRAPSGHFHLIEDDSHPAILIAGGIGITPMISMLNALLKSKSRREIWLFYSVKNCREIIMHEYLRSCTDTYSSFHLVISCTNPDPSDRIGLDYQHKGRIDIPLLQSKMKNKKSHFYVCGPGSMMESMIPGLKKWGVKKQNIFYESFGPASLEKPALPGSASFAVTFTKSGKILTWTPDAGTLLSFAEDHGISVESGCRAGSCGSCLTELTSGKVQYSQNPETDIPDGYCLLCTGIPVSDITLAV